MDTDELLSRAVGCAAPEYLRRHGEVEFVAVSMRRWTRRSRIPAWLRPAGCRHARSGSSPTREPDDLLA